MTAALEGTTSAASEVCSTMNQVVTLQASASGCCGYCSQELSATQSSSVDSLAAENSALPSDITSNIADTSVPIPLLDIESDTPHDSGTKPRPKQKNTTTVG